MSDPDRVVIGRTETLPGEYSNIHVEIELHARKGETTDELLERASEAVRRRLVEEYRKRKARHWTEAVPYEQERLEVFDAPEDAA